VERDWAITTKSIKGEKGKVTKLIGAKVEWLRDEATGQMRMQEVAGSEFEIKADLVLLAMGFVSPINQMLQSFGVEMDPRGNARANTDDYQTSVPKIFAAGDVRRGQSLVVWAIREGRQCARAVDEFLMGVTELPR
jgi:glutamate synthase (NADPH/NADH) small chain